MSAVELMELYEKDNFMKQFVPIIKEKAKYPLIVDKDDIICSLPPIINGEHSKVWEYLHISDHYWRLQSSPENMRFFVEVSRARITDIFELCTRKSLTLGVN